MTRGLHAAYINRGLETLLPTLFHTASALSAPAWPPPLEGKGDRGAVDRVLSLTVICSKTFFHLHHPLSCRSAPPTSALRAPPSKGRRDRYTRNAPHSRPFLWKGLSSVARRGWLPPYVGNAFSPYRYPHHFRASPFIKINAKRCSASAFPSRGRLTIWEYRYLKCGEAAT